MVFPICFLLNGCTGGEAPDKAQGKIPIDTSKTEKQVEKAESARQIFRYIPSPVESAALLQQTGAEYDAELLNAIENVSTYETILGKSLNLGIYSTDLSFASMYEQTHEIMVYSACSKKLADALGVTEAFSEGTIERIETNLEEKDSILTIITDAYWLTEKHLKENKRSSLSVLIMTGGWIEGLYLATMLAQADPDNENLVQRIGEQKYSLEHLLQLLEQYKPDHKIKTVREDLEPLKAAFQKLEMEALGKPNIETDEKSGTTVINTGKQVEMTPILLQEIMELVKGIRGKYIRLA